MWSFDRLFSPRRRRRNRAPLWLRTLLADQRAQFAFTIVGAIVFTGFIFAGLLVLRYTDQEDIIARGNRYMTEGKVAWAAQTFQTLVNQNKDDYKAHLLLGKAFLAMGDRKKAESEFRTALSLKPNNSQDFDAEIATSKLYIAQDNFPDAEAVLLNINKRSKNSKTLASCLFDLYEQWGDHIMGGDHTVSDVEDTEAVPNYDDAIEKYEKSLRYATNFPAETAVKNKLVEAMTTYANLLASTNRLENAIAVMTQSMRYRYSADSEISLAALYEKSNQLDEAIRCYRKAFEANPNLLSVKLSHLLMKRGKELLAANKKDAAQQLFDEAERVVQAGSGSDGVLYPVSLVVESIIAVDKSSKKVKAPKDPPPDETLNPDDPASAISSSASRLISFTPQVRIRVQNKNAEPLNSLFVKTQFYAGTELLDEVITNIASNEQPLTTVKKIKVKPEQGFSTSLFTKTPLKVKVYLCYTNEPDEKRWSVKAVHDINILNSSPKMEADTSSIGTEAINH